MASPSVIVLCLVGGAMAEHGWPVCPHGYEQLGHVGDDVPGWGLSYVGNTASSKQACADQCTANSQCGDFEWNDGSCALNDRRHSTARAQISHNRPGDNSGWINSLTCKKKVSLCPDGYEQLGHVGDDVPGWGISYVGNTASSKQACADQCSANSQCGDFEWNDGSCALNDRRHSTARAQTSHNRPGDNSGWINSLTCKKKVSLCPDGYKQLGHVGDDVPGWGISYVGNTASSKQACADQCSANNQCGDFEWNDGSCALNGWSDSTASAQTSHNRPGDDSGWINSLTCKKFPTTAAMAVHTNIGVSAMFSQLNSMALVVAVFVSGALMAIVVAAVKKQSRKTDTMSYIMLDEEA